MVPADHKPFAHLLVAKALIEALENLDLKYPVVGDAALKDLKKARAMLVAEKDD